MKEILIAKLTLDTFHRNKIAPLVVPKGDYGARVIQARIKDYGNPISVGIDDAVSIVAKRSGGGDSLAFSGRANQDGTVTVPVTQWMLDIPEDDVVCHIVVTGNDYQYSTTSFLIQPQEKENPTEISEDDPRVDVITEVLANENARISAENERVSNEEERKSNEEERKRFYEETKPLFVGVENFLTNNNIVQSTGNSSTAVMSQKTTTDAIGGVAKYVADHMEKSTFEESAFQMYSISTETGQNEHNGAHIRTEGINKTKEDFTVAMPNNIGGYIYYYSDFNLNAFTRADVLMPNSITKVAVGTYYRLVFFYADLSAPNISDIVSSVVLLKYVNKPVKNLEHITQKKLDKKRFQLNSISTTTGQNTSNSNHIRTEALLQATENFTLVLPSYIKGYIYHYSAFSLASFTSAVEMEPNSMTYVGKGMYYRLVFFYAGMTTPNIDDIIDNIGVTCNLLDKMERIDLTTDDDKWSQGGIDIATGVSDSTKNTIRTGYIQKSSYSVVATGCYGVSVYVYDGDTYLGCLNDANILSTENVQWFKEIDLNDLANRNPEYNFRVVATRLGATGAPLTDVMSASEGAEIKLFTTFEKRLFDEKITCPLVSFIDDDAHPEALSNWLGLGNETGVRCGFAVPTGAISDDVWTTIEGMYSAGYDFLSHTHRHITLMGKTAEEISADLQASVEAFHDHGIDVKGLVYPNSSIDKTALSTLKNYFEYSFNGGSGISSIQGNPMRHHNITRTTTVEIGTSDYTDPTDGITYRVHAMLPLAELKSYVDYAVENNCWIVFLSHFRNSRTTDESNDGFIFTDEMKQRTIDLIRYAVDQGCRVVTPSEGFNLMKNRLMRGTYGGGSYYIVDRNGFKYRKNM